MAGINETARLLAELELRDKFSGPARNITSAVDNLDRRVGGLQGTFGRVGAGLSQMGRGVGQIGHGLDQAATRAVIATVGIGTALITTAASFETAEAGIRKTVGGIESEVDALIEGVKDMSRVVPVSFEELAAITAEGGALGIANENLLAFTDVVARLGVSTDLSTDQAASAIGQLANVLHLDDTGIRDFADSLVALGNNGASTESQIIDLATRFGAAGHQAGLSNEAILALASTTASMGIEAEAGGGALSRVFNNITLDIATATEEGQILAEQMGLSLAELRTAWDEDAGAVFGDLLQVLSELDNFQQAELLSNLGITNVRDINAITLLASGVEEYNKQLGISVGQTNELNTESDVFFNTTEGKWQIFQNNVRLAADAIGGKLLPVVNTVLGDLVAKLSDPEVQAGIEEFGTNLATGVSDFIDEIKRVDFGPLLGTLRGAAEIAKGAFDAFRSLPEPIQQLALAAIVANKVTGGAVGSIASGLGNLLGGAFKIAFLDRGTATNPMWVRQVGLPGVGGGAPGAGGGIGKLALGLTGVGLAAILADEFEEEIDGLASEVALAIGGGKPLIDIGGGPETWQWPFGSANPPTWLPEFLGGPGPDMSNPYQITPAEGREILKTFATGTRNSEMSKLLLPGFSEARNVGGSPFLPETNVPFPGTQPLTSALTDLTTVIREQPRGKGPFGPLAPHGPEAGNFVPTVKLDSSQVTDMREPTRLAYEATLKLAADARAADQANRTYSNFIVSKQEAIAAAVRDSTNVLRSKEFNPKFSVTANVTTNVSISEIQRKVTSQAIALGLPIYRDANVR